MRGNFWELVAVVATMVVMMAVPAYVRKWEQDTTGWWYENSDGTYLASQWEWVDGECYYFGTNECMLANGTAPDGFTVDEKDGWTVNGAVQAKNDGIGSNGFVTNEQYPLKRRIENNLVQGSDGTIGQKQDVMYISWNPDQGGMHVMNHTIQGRSPSYLSFYRSLNVAVLVEPAGYPATGLGYIGQNKKTKMVGEVRELLNSFDWRNASDYEKVVHITNWTIRADYDYAESEDYHYPYGCLVNKMVMCDRYTDAVWLLGTRIGVPVSLMGPFSRAYPVFLADGVWLIHEPTSKNKFFTTADVYETSHVFEKVNQLFVIGQYCQGVGYGVLTDVSNRSSDMRIGQSKGKAAQMIYFK